MTARVLVVDDIQANVKLLEARLSAEYFGVLTACSGAEGLDICSRERVDVVLLDVMMPGMDGFEVCRRLKANPATQHIPVVMVTALDQTSDKVQGLEAGADDFLTKPVDDVALITRVRNLGRLKMLNDEILLRAETGQRLGLAPGEALADPIGSEKGRILLVDDDPRSAARIAGMLAGLHETVVEGDLQTALMTAAEQPFDLLIVSLSLAGADGLRLCSQVRSLDRTRHLGIVMLVEPADEGRLLRGLDLGANDYLMRPIDRHEMLARVRTQIRRKRHSELLRSRLTESVELSIRDALTGLFNRRYMESHLKTLVDEAAATGRPLSILVADIDLFKQINDTHGHASGDAVLKEFAARVRRSTRGADLACRLGGEEFVVVMPDTEVGRACQIGERLRAAIAADPFQLDAGGSVRMTASFGAAAVESADDSPAALFRRADRALYSAKRAGRNRVAVGAA
ncbi:MAG: PleD family two-component system response regulator [Hyphomicrobiaceae bacterium]|nr:PleD family two-component system response regulator [Hyphomicrobiaceae bacterium]